MLLEGGPNTHKVEKAHKRLWITRVETEQRIYTPPNFVRVASRDELQQVCRLLDAQERYIDVVMAYETAAKRVSG